ncbi:ABC transporter ATP-binding protein [Roseinatronobacter alkalisoli]|uniref:ATP-binding cassette domain-containing protein n=1 Tax=Roseinatronobacter alkalisoli TaxID=3028235 RepID=A0ABT5T7G3_9RHOB|nr:ATP-binding cassette domain-containing protein [Roseinatronobacter sp. HJB301]MDD7971063.1 ATP-binding cassette domain-containing protein [Roseinatronobacter sp. HJB301]
MNLQVAIREKRFGAVPVLRDLVFQVAHGEVLAVLGPSGVGKSTLLRIVAGLDTGFDGQIRRAGRLAMVFQEPTLMPWRNALDNLRLTTGVDACEGEAALARVGLAGKGALYPGQLSLGQQRRLSLARAYAAKPDILLLDEPFVSLDAALVDDMLALTESVITEQRPATVFVTHAQAEADRLATRQLVLGSVAAA